MFLPHRAWVGVLGWTGSPAGPGLTVRAGSVCGSAGEQKRTHEERNNKLRAHTSTRLLRSLPLSISLSIYPPGLSVHLKASSPTLTEEFELCSHERTPSFLPIFFLLHTLPLNIGHMCTCDPIHPPTRTHAALPHRAEKHNIRPPFDFKFSVSNAKTLICLFWSIGYMFMNLLNQHEALVLWTPENRTYIYDNTSNLSVLKCRRKVGEKTVLCEITLLKNKGSKRVFAAVMP